MGYQSIGFGFFDTIYCMFCDSYFCRMNVNGTNFTVRASTEEDSHASLDFWVESCSSVALIAVLFAASLNRRIRQKLLAALRVLQTLTTDDYTQASTADTSV